MHMCVRGGWGGKGTDLIISFLRHQVRSVYYIGEAKQGFLYCTLTTHCLLQW